jgi:hypothetical protein
MGRTQLLLVNLLPSAIQALKLVAEAVHMLLGATISSHGI